MRHIVFFIFFLPVKTFAQEWVDYYHDSTLIVSMPYYHYEREENGLLLSSAKVEGGVIAVTHMHDDASKHFNVRNESDLKHTYSFVRDELIKTQQGKLLTSNIFEKDGLKWIYFIDRGSASSVEQDIHNLVVFVNDGIYCLTFFEMGPRTPEKDGARQKIFSSARIAPGISKKQISRQIYSPPVSFKNFFDPVLLTIICIGVGTALVFLIARFKKKRNLSQKSSEGEDKEKDEVFSS